MGDRAPPPVPDQHRDAHAAYHSAKKKYVAPTPPPPRGGDSDEDSDDFGRDQLSLPPTPLNAEEARKMNADAYAINREREDRFDAEAEHEHRGKFGLPPVPSMHRVKSALKVLGPTGSSTDLHVGHLTYAHDSDSDGGLDEPETAPLKKAFLRAGLALGANYSRLKKQIDKKHAVERACMCMLAVLLLWTTSLAVARSIVFGAMTSPTLPLVVDSISNAFNQTFDERDRYTLCAERLVAECNHTFVSALNAEIQRTARVVNRNQDALANYTNTRQVCTNAYRDTLAMADLLQGVDDFFNYPLPPVAANATVCDNVAAVLANQRAALAALNAAENYKAQADDEMESLFDFMERKAAYDREYMYNKTGIMFTEGINLNALLESPAEIRANLNKSMNEMIACSKMSGIYAGEICPQSPNPMQQYSQNRDALVTEYNNMRTTMQNFNADLISTFQPLADFYEGFKNKILTVGGLLSAVGNALGGEGSSLSGMGFTYADTDLNAPGLLSTTAFTNSFPFMDDISTDFALRQLEAEMGLGLGELSYNKQFTVNGTLSWQGAFLDDYEPPPVDTNRKRTDWAATSDKYLPDISDDLKLVAYRIEQRGNGTYNGSSSTSAIELKATQLISQLDPRNWDFFAYGGLFLDDYMAGWRRLTRLALMSDYVFRTIRTLQIILYYWNISSMSTPPADVRIGDVKKGVARPSAKKNPIQMIGFLVTHPAVNVFLLVLFLFLVSRIFYRVYTPFYNEYITGCVDGDFDRGNGTMLTRNSVSVGYNFAASNGDTIMSAEVDRINFVREAKCTASTEETFQQQVADEDEYEFLVREYTKTAYDNDGFRICFDIDAIDAAYPLLAPNATNERVDFMRDTVFEDLCINEEFALLETAVFNCDEDTIPVCPLNCQGPTADRLASITHDSACKTEWFMHSAVLGTVLALLAFVLMNVSRIYFMRAIARICWRSLTGNKFSYLATTNEKGVTHYPKEVTEEGQSMKETIAYQLAVSIRKFERWGYYLLMFAVTLNLPWIIALMEVSSTLDKSAAIFSKDGSGTQ